MPCMQASGRRPHVTKPHLCIGKKMELVTDERVLFAALDKGIDDMEAGRELPLDEAFEEIERLLYRK